MSKQPITLPINTDLLTQLKEQNHAIIDNFIPQEVADQLLTDANRLYSENQFQQHYFQFGGSLLKKPNVFELDLSDNGKQQLDNNRDVGLWKDIVGDVGPSFLRRIDELDRNMSSKQSTTTSSSSSSSLPSLSLQTNTPPAIKIQINTGGGSFPWHFDNPGPPNARILTCVVYLNPHWTQGDGGEIVLRPTFLSKSNSKSSKLISEQHHHQQQPPKNENAITIPPMHRRAVFFLSDRVLHRVLPSKSTKRRVCFTMWCNGTGVNTREDVVLSKDVLRFTSWDEAHYFFDTSPLQRVISRAVYSEEYLESLLECLVVGGNDGTAGGGGDDDDDVGGDAEGVTEEEKEMLVKQHEASVLGIRRKLQPLIDEFRRRKYSE